MSFHLIWHPKKLALLRKKTFPIFSLLTNKQTLLLNCFSFCLIFSLFSFFTHPKTHTHTLLYFFVCLLISLFCHLLYLLSFPCFLSSFASCLKCKFIFFSFIESCFFVSTSPLHLINLFTINPIVQCKPLANLILPFYHYQMYYI